MESGASPITRLPIRLAPDTRRVIARKFIPGDEDRIRSLIERVLRLSDAQVEHMLAQLEQRFASRHRNAAEMVADHYNAVEPYVPQPHKPDVRRQLLIGSYFTMEYAIESAALFNPSMVPARDQTGLPTGSTRFVMSLRATGEGHISSLVFRRGVVDADDNLEIEPASPYCRSLEVIDDAPQDKESFRQKLIDMGAYGPYTEFVVNALKAQFTIVELNRAIRDLRISPTDPAAVAEVAETMIWLARSNYQLLLPEDADVSEVVIFPHSETESHGIEDARFVKFTDDGGSYYYYGTYTAYNGYRIMPQLFEIDEALAVKVSTIHGRFAQNKGMALFPRKIDGKYTMISRLDNENLFLMQSDQLYSWNEAKRIQEPKYPWEFVQIGNCGSPLETEAGWLLLTHGVGPMRQYCIGATLLSRDNPAEVIGQTREPLLEPEEDERSGYVPNVVYSCGGMIHNEMLIIPYAMSDLCTGFAKVRLQDVLALCRD